MEELEIYKGLRKIAVKQLGELHQKGSMSNSEAEAAKVAMCLIDMIDERVPGEGEEGEYSERRSSYGHPYRRYNITSYEDGRSMRGNRSYGMYPMYDDYYPMGSYREDAYHGSYENQNRDGRGRYSSHSIDDRVVSMLEGMVDGAKSDYEHQRLMEYIRYARSKEQGE